MDVLAQTKLTASEWESIEIPISNSELKIMEMIHDCYPREHINKITNNHLNMIRFTKIDPNPEIHAFLYSKYFYPIIQKNLEKMKPHWKSFHEYTFNTAKLTKKLKKADSIRIENSDTLIRNNQHDIFEFDSMEMCNTIFTRALAKKSFAKELYTLLQWKQAMMDHMNPHVIEFTNMVIEYGKNHVRISTVVNEADHIVEKNADLYKYENISLFSHQKELFSLCAQPPLRKPICEGEDMDGVMLTPKPKLILYTAPTGTGKTLSPIGLVHDYKVIFVCVARHVGLALAKSAISLGKRVAFAFGCESPSDIRLHYFAAADYTKNRKSGGIWKVNHSVGDKVELIICDVYSYLHAMRYMMAFTEDQSRLLTYWDEPTMTLDYEKHPLHSVIQKNWEENEIYNMVLSCATLPKENELQDTITDFRAKVHEYFERFQEEQESKENIQIENAIEDAEENDMNYEVVNALPSNRDEDTLYIVHTPYIPKEPEQNTVYIRKYIQPEITVEVNTIHSYDCRKSIPILNQEGYSFMPHIHCDTIEELHQYGNYCKENKTLLRYFDLKEIVRFIQYVHLKNYLKRENHHCEQYFESIEDVSMNKLKLYYLELIQSITDQQWYDCKAYLSVQQDKKYGAIRKSSSKLSSTVSGGGGELSRLNSIPASNVKSNGFITRNNSESQVDTLRQRSLEGVYLTTKDAHTLTDGPSIYLADNILNMANFYMKASNIPDTILKQLVESLVKNDKLQEQLEILEDKLEQELAKGTPTTTSTVQSKKGSKKQSTKDKNMDNENNVNMQNIKGQIENMRGQMKQIALNPNYVPNTYEHQEKWVPGGKISENVFSSSLTENDVKAILEMNIGIQYKVLALMGVGVLIQQEDKSYEEIIKQLAVDQKLFLILTSSDYIYGTNYQFCHGFIGKDLKKMTPQKTLQAMGRVGRNKYQQDYTIRFRDDSMIHGLFKTPEFNQEAYNMNNLFCRAN